MCARGAVVLVRVGAVNGAIRIHAFSAWIFRVPFVPLQRARAGTMASGASVQGNVACAGSIAASDASSLLGQAPGTGGVKFYGTGFRSKTVGAACHGLFTSSLPQFQSAVASACAKCALDASTGACTSDAEAQCPPECVLVNGADASLPSGGACAPFAVDYAQHGVGDQPAPVSVRGFLETVFAVGDPESPGDSGILNPAKGAYTLNGTDIKSVAAALLAHLTRHPECAVPDLQGLLVQADPDGNGGYVPAVVNATVPIMTPAKAKEMAGMSGTCPGFETTSCAAMLRTLYMRRFAMNTSSDPSSGFAGQYELAALWQASGAPGGLVPPPTPGRSNVLLLSLVVLALVVAAIVACVVLGVRDAKERKASANRADGKRHRRRRGSESSSDSGGSRE